MSEVSAIYKQYEESLKKSRKEYEESIKEWADALSSIYNKYLEDFISSFGNEFESQIGRIKAKETASSFFGREELPFVAIDGSCYKEEHEGFLSFYGGAYGSRGNVTFEADTAKLQYERWGLSEDVSMVSFLPLPPDQVENSVESVEKGEARFRTDSEIRKISGLHTKIMQLAEIYLAYSVIARGGVGYPRIVLLDTTLSGLLGNTSYTPRSLNIIGADLDGERLSKLDSQVALAHPFNENLNVPRPKENQPWDRIFFAADQKNSKRVTLEESDLPEEVFKRAGSWLEDQGLAEHLSDSDTISLRKRPRSAWRTCVNVFESVCERLFREKEHTALSYQVEGERRFMGPSDISFLTGVGIRKLIELAWRKNVLLIGVVKDSSSRYFYRNFLGSAAATGKTDDYIPVPLADRQIIELLPHIAAGLQAPWGTVEFDSAFMTLHPEERETGETGVEEYTIPGTGKVARPERIFLRSINQYLLNRDRGILSHGVFIDRLVYPRDVTESEEWDIEVDRVGELKPLYFESGTSSTLQYMTQFLLSVLVRNHFPEALGYPDPLHKADWGAKSMRRRAKKLVESGGRAMKSRPMNRTFREIRERFGR